MFVVLIELPGGTLIADYWYVGDVSVGHQTTKGRVRYLLRKSGPKVAGCVTCSLFAMIGWWLSVMG